MALRIKSHWHGDSDRSLSEIASALAFIGWRLAHTKTINLHGENFVFDNDRQRMDVIIEYVIFELQIVDRLAHQRYELPDQEHNRVEGVLQRCHLSWGRGSGCPALGHISQVMRHAAGP